MGPDLGLEAAEESLRRLREWADPERCPPLLATEPSGAKGHLVSAGAPSRRPTSQAPARGPCAARTHSVTAARKGPALGRAGRDRTHLRGLTYPASRHCSSLVLGAAGHVLLGVPSTAGVADQAPAPAPASVTAREAVPAGVACLEGGDRRPSQSWVRVSEKRRPLRVPVRGGGSGLRGARAAPTRGTLSSLSPRTEEGPARPGRQVRSARSRGTDGKRQRVRWAARSRSRRPRPHRPRFSFSPPRGTWLKD